MSHRPARSKHLARREFRQRPTYIAAVGLVLLAAFLVVVYVGVRSPFGLPVRHYRVLEVQVRDPGNVQIHDPVRIAGVRIGQVVAVEPGKGAAEGQSLLKLKLDPGADALPSDTTVMLPAAGLLGARYVELRPGKSHETLDDGAVIRAGRDAVSYGVTDALDTFDEPTRVALDRMINQFGLGLLARGPGLNDAIRRLPGGESDFRRLTAAIFARPGAARRFVPSGAASAAAFDGARDDFARMLRPIGVGLRPFVDERAAVRATLDEAPPALTSLDTGMRRGQQLLRAARDLSEAAADTLPAAPAGLRATTTLLATSRLPLRRTTRLLNALRPTVPAILRITKALSPNLSMLRGGFDDAARLAKAIAPYDCDLENGAHSFRSLIGYPVGPSIDGGMTGPWSGFRAVAIAGGPELTGTLVPTIGGSAGVRAEPYPAACKYSPGHRYVGGHVVTPYTDGGGR